jgi:hypothetical protein
LIVLLAAECSTPISEVERMPLAKAIQYYEATVRLLKAKVGK